MITEFANRRSDAEISVPGFDLKMVQYAGECRLSINTWAEHGPHLVDRKNLETLISALQVMQMEWDFAEKNLEESYPRQVMDEIPF